MNEQDLIRFNKDPIFEIRKIEELLASFFEKDLNVALNNYLTKSGVKIWKGTTFTRNKRNIEFINNWFWQGVACSVLKVGDKNWDLGRLKIKIRIEFEPLESEELESEDLDGMAELGIDEELMLLKKKLEDLHIEDFKDR